MNTIQEANNAIRELTAHELVAVAGGYVQCTLKSKTVTTTRVCQSNGACTTTTVTVKNYTC